jgi:hypothetical protein
MDPIEKIVKDRYNVKAQFDFFLLDQLFFNPPPRPAEPAHGVPVVRFPNLSRTAPAARPARANCQERAAEAQRSDCAIRNEVVAFQPFARLVVVFLDYKPWLHWNL